MFYYTYILESDKDKSLYIGFTSDLRKRLKEHNTGKSLYTRSRGPYKLIFFEGFTEEKDAIKREKYLKSGWGRKSINKLLSIYFS